MTKNIIENEKIKNFNENKFKENYIKEGIHPKDNPEPELVSDKIMRKYASIFRRFKKHFGRVVDVPLRLNGKTGRGVIGQCHSNVAELVQRVGGKCVRGYMLNRLQNGNMTAFIWHSVWQTPEGKLVDVTLSSTKDYEDRKVIQFIPVVTFDPLKTDYWFIEDFIVHDDRHKGLLIREEESYRKHVPFNWFKKYIFKPVKCDTPFIEHDIHKTFLNSVGFNVFNINKRKLVA